jgi:hypothetical protein
MIAPERLYREATPETLIASTILPALRELLGEHPETAACSLEELAYRLRTYTDRTPPPFEVQAAMEALRVEGEVLP